MQNLTKIMATALLFTASQAAVAITAVPDVFFIPQDAEFFYLDIFGNDDIDFDTFVFPQMGDLQQVEGDVPTVDSFSPEGLYITPPPGYTGTIGFLYTIADASGTSQTVISIEVQAGGSNHQAAPDFFYVDQDEVAEFTLTTNDNFNFNNGYPVIILGAQSDKGGQLVPLLGDPTDVEYTPPPGFVGQDFFTYEMQDAQDPGLTSTTSVVIYVGLDPNEIPEEEEEPPAEEEPNEEGFESIPGLNEEDQQTYDVIIDVCNGPTSSDLPCDEIGQLSSDQTRTLLRQVSGQHTKLQSRSMRESRSEQSGNVRSRLKEIRGGVNRVSVGNLNAAIFGESVPLASLLQGKLNDELQGGSAGDGDLTTPWGFFVNGNITLGEGKNRNNRTGYDQDGYNLTMGIDYRISDKLVAGLAAGYGKSELDFNGDMGNQESDNYSLSLFGNYYPRNNLYIDGLIMLVSGGIDVERRISVGDSILNTISQDLSSDADSQQLVLSTSAGYEYSIQRLQGSVYGRLEYSDLTIDSYQETGGSFALGIAKQETSSFDGAIGTRLGYVFNLRRGVVVPSVELEYVKREEDDYNIEARLLNTAESFLLTAAEEDNEYLNLSTSVSAVFSGGRSGFLRYETMLRQDNYKMSSYSFGFRIEF